MIHVAKCYNVIELFDEFQVYLCQTLKFYHKCVEFEPTQAFVFDLLEQLPHIYAQRQRIKLKSYIMI